MRRWLLALRDYGPWVAVLVLLWREQTLEQAISNFVAKSHDALQAAVRDVTVQAREVVSDEEASRGSGAVWADLG